MDERQRKIELNNLRMQIERVNARVSTGGGLPGPEGPAGPVGPQGPIGLTGNNGAAGATGSQGPIGNTGPQGPQGLIGNTGPQGPIGNTGPQGIQGIQGVPGTDPWTYSSLSVDFTTSSATAVDITGLAFTPLANTVYEFEALLLLRTATATVGPRPGLAWPTGLTDGAASIIMPSSLTAQLITYGNISAALLTAVGGLPTTTGSFLAIIQGLLFAGATPSGNLRLQLASETAGTIVTCKARSFIKRRIIA